ncbi:MAG: hypothetical protein WBQ20_17155 [Methyloceanibacter sp.]
MSETRYHAREAAAALLKLAKTTSNPGVAAGLIEAAANLKDHIGELPPLGSAKAPDVQAEGEPPETA